MTNDETKWPLSTPIRGAIRTLIGTSTDAIVAGREFSIFVTVQNPFEVPLILRQITAHLPTEFADLDQRARSQQIVQVQQRLRELAAAGRPLGLSAPAAATATTATPKSSGRWRLQSVRFDLPCVGVEYGEQPGWAVAREIGGPAATATARLSAPLLGSYELSRSLDKVEDDGQREAIKEHIAQDIDEHEILLANLERDEAISRELQPGNSTTRAFTLRTRRGVWFTPSAYRLQIEIEYEIAGIVNVDTIDHQLQVKSSLTSVVLGSLVGAVGGWIVKEGATSIEQPATWLRLFVSLVLAAMTVVLFARKKDVQPLIAVEDFWGGVGIGFIAAYLGTGVLENLLPPANNALPSAGQSLPAATPTP